MNDFQEIKNKYSKEDLKLIIDGLSDKLKLLNESIEDFDAAIKLNPNYSEAYNNRGKSIMACIEAKKKL